jgi:hypothetical protein
LTAATINEAGPKKIVVGLNCLKLEYVTSLGNSYLLPKFLILTP